MSKPYILSIYFGVPGSGKTTYAAYLAKKDLKKKRKVYSNVPITGTIKVDKSDFGRYMINDCRILLDEAGIDYNNRDFKKFTDSENYFFKYHRHYQVHLDLFSQGYDEMDKKLRLLAQKLYVVKKSLIPFFIVRRTIGKRVGINEMSKEIIDEYYFRPFSYKWIFCPLVWSMFNTYSRKELPEREWEKW